MFIKKYTGIGVMTGTSLDGIDLAFCEFIEEGESYTFKTILAETIPMESRWQDRLSKLPQQSAEIYAKTHVYFAHYLGQEISGFIRKNGLKPNFVAVHGQTIFHQPDKTFTAQIGDGETLVTYLDCPLVCNFRNKDVALSGQGAPLVPIGEKYLFPQYNTFLNLGGFANLTYKGTAFDVVPCNVVLNTLVQVGDYGLRYDDNGAIAESGSIHKILQEELDKNPYFNRKPPKSLGWEWVLNEVFPIIKKHSPEIPDALRTYTEHIGLQIYTALRRLSVTEETMLITGGGRHNAFLMYIIDYYLKLLNIKIQAEERECTDFKEAIIFAFLGLRTLTGKTNTMPSVTGAKIPAVSGSVHFPVKGGISIL